ncbi:MAG: thermonuclease family protein [Sulfurifustaceae bacterium]
MRLADGREVRLIGINAPEIGKNGTPDDPLAREARYRTMGLTRGQTVRIEYGSERFDRYGRTLAYALLADGRDLQEILVREGLAWYVAIPPNITRLERYRAAEAEARRLRRGVWSRPEYAPVAAEELKPERSGFIRLAGTVRAVYRRGDYTDLVIAPMIELRLPADVVAALGRSPQSLIGRRVVARGWLTEYKSRHRLRVTHPAMLEDPS